MQRLLETAQDKAGGSSPDVRVNHASEVAYIGSGSPVPRVHPG